MSMEQFHINVEQEVLDDLNYRLKHIRWPKNSENKGWERGTDQAYLQSLVSY